MMQSIESLRKTVEWALANGLISRRLPDRPSPRPPRHIRRARLSRNGIPTWKEIAHQLGYSVSFVHSVHTGRAKNPAIEARLAELARQDKLPSMLPLKKCTPQPLPA